MTVPCLLDTNALIWAVVDDVRLGPEARRVVGAGTDVVVSVVSLWEVVVKTSIGKLRPMPWLAGVVADRGVRRLGVDDRHLEALADLPLVHRDPFDRMLIAQAQVEGLTILTSDAAFGRYDVPLLDARS